MATEEPIVVFFALEISDREMDCDILQIYMKRGEHEFNRYIDPVKEISQELSAINHMTIQDSQLYRDAVKINTSPRRAVLKDLYVFLKQFGRPCTLIAHKSCNRDSIRLIHALKKEKFTMKFNNVIAGFTCSLDLFSDKFPAKGKKDFAIHRMAREMGITSGMSKFNKRKIKSDTNVLEQVLLHHFSTAELVAKQSFAQELKRFEKLFPAPKPSSNKYDPDSRVTTVVYVAAPLKKKAGGKQQLDCSQKVDSSQQTGINETTDGKERPDSSQKACSNEQIGNNKKSGGKKPKVSQKVCDSQQTGSDRKAVRKRKGSTSDKADGKRQLRSSQRAGNNQQTCSGQKAGGSQQPCSSQKAGNNQQTCSGQKAGGSQQTCSSQKAGNIWKIDISQKAGDKWQFDCNQEAGGSQQPESGRKVGGKRIPRGQRKNIWKAADQRKTKWKTVMPEKYLQQERLSPVNTENSLPALMDVLAKMETPKRGPHFSRILKGDPKVLCLLLSEKKRPKFFTQSPRARKGDPFFLDHPVSSVAANVPSRIAKTSFFNPKL